MADNESTWTPGSVPPKMDLKKSGILRSSPGTPPPASKKETTKIPLDAARPPASAPALPPGGLKKPTTIRMEQPAAAPARAATPDEEVATKKRTTSRISLESVFTSTAQQAPAAGEPVVPRTIRLKRPDEAASPRVTADLNNLRVPRQPQESQDSVPTMRAQRDVSRPEPAAERETPTRRKTLVIRHDQKQDRRPMTIARPGAEDQLAAPGGIIRIPDIMHWSFPVCMILAMIIVMVNIYVFLAQVIGPDISLTQHSYQPTGSSLDWPGKIGR